MKTLAKILTIGLAGSLSLGAFNARANVDVSVGVQINAAADFYEPLTPHGAWVEVGGYGRCWRPTRVAVGWRPYCYGHWVWTDCGWYWASDEPWSWACYHYGSWTFDAGFGWVWVPGVEWAPAWVYWRVGGGHIGWAPCGPRGVVVAPSLFVFVDNHRFSERHRPSTVIVNNTTIINNTTEITQIRRETRNFDGRSREIVINNGPGVEPVQRATGKKVTPVPVQTVDRETPVPTSMKNRKAGFRSSEQSPSVQEQPASAPERMDRRTSPSQEQPSPGRINRQTEPRERPERSNDKKAGPTRTWQPEQNAVPEQKPEQTIAPQQPQRQEQENVLPSDRSPKRSPGQQQGNERVAPSQKRDVTIPTPQPGNERVMPQQPGNERVIPQEPRRNVSPSERPRGTHPQYYRGRTPQGNAPRYREQHPSANRPVPPAQGEPSGVPSEQQNKGGDKEQKKDKD